MTSISYLFRIGVSTVSEIISETTDALWKVLVPICVAPPSEDKWMQIATNFGIKWNFPNCIGAIDGKHVIIQAPPNSGSSYFNYKGSHSIVLLAVVDDNYSFSLVDIGAQGRQSDGGVLRNSAFGKLLYEHKLHIPAPQKITVDGPELPFVIVGDEAFPLSENLLKPYSSKGGLPLNEAVFNYRLSRARRISENAFGILNARWRIYTRNMIGKMENIISAVKATKGLHNFIIRKYSNNSYMSPALIDSEKDGVMIPGTWRNYPTQLGYIGRGGSNTYRRNPKEIRDEYCRYFNEEGAVSWQWDRI